MKEDEKLGQKQVSKVTLHFVWGHFSRKQTVLQQIKRSICLKLFPIFAGLRGAVGFSLVEILDKDMNHYKNLFVTTTLFMIAFTVFLQGGTIKLFVEKLKIRKKVAAVRTQFSTTTVICKEAYLNRPCIIHWVGFRAKLDN